jgi:predicted alpha-1,2-mannosidase
MQKASESSTFHKAYAACRQTAAGTGATTNRPDNDFYLENGYVPDQVSWTLDNSYYDWCVGRLAEYLGNKDDTKLFGARALNYRNIYDRQVGFIRAKDRSGQNLKWLGETEFGQGCTESNPLQQTWSVPHDIYGLIDLMGKDRFVTTLEDMFEKTPNNFGWNPYYNHSNEPVHHVPYLFVYAGQPWRTQKWVRRILEQAYHAEVNGICGNDDVGQMSAWYVLSALGIYPVCPGDKSTFWEARFSARLSFAWTQMAQRHNLRDRRARKLFCELLHSIGTVERKTAGAGVDYPCGDHIWRNVGVRYGAPKPNFEWGTSAKVPSGVFSTI